MRSTRHGPTPGRRSTGSWGCLAGSSRAGSAGAPSCARTAGRGTCSRTRRSSGAHRRRIGLRPLTISNRCSSLRRPMASLSPDVSAALASLQTRWGAAAPKVIGALATAPLPADPPDDLDGLAPAPASEPRTGVERVVRTGFPDLDAIVGPGGLPRSASVALKGAPSSGATTLALRLVAEAQV